MQLFTDDEVIATLRCVNCGVSEYREVGRIALNYLSDEQQQFVYSLLDSEDEQLRICAIYGIRDQNTWTVPSDVFQKLKNIYLNDPYVYARRVAIDTLCNLNVPIKMKIDAIKNLLEKENELYEFFDLASGEKEIADYFYDDVVKLTQTQNEALAGKESYVTDFFSKCGKWNNDVEIYLQKVLQSGIKRNHLHVIHALLDIDIPKNKLIDFLLIASKTANERNSIMSIIKVAGKKNVIINILPAFFQHIDQLETLAGEYSDNDDNVIGIGIEMSPYLKQFGQNLESYWKEYGENSQGIILTTLLHSQEKNVFAEKIALEALDSPNNLNLTLGIALCLYYNVSITNIPAIPDEILENNDYYVTKLVLWIARQQICCFDMPKLAINKLQNTHKSDYNEADDLIGHLIFCRHQYRKIINSIDEALVNYSITDHSYNFLPGQMKLFVQELQHTAQESIEHLARFSADKCDKLLGIPDIDKSKLDVLQTITSSNNVMQKWAVS